VTDTVLVTGAGGFAGGYLLDALVASGHRSVVAWARRPAAYDGADTTAGVRWQSVDLLDVQAVRRAIDEIRPGRVFHVAGSPHVAASWKDTATPLAGNVLASHHLFDALRRAGCHSRVVVTGSATVYAASTEPLAEDAPVGPSNPYAVSKLAQEDLSLRAAREDGLEVIVARAFNHTGPRQSAEFAAPAFARQVAMIECGECPPVIRVGNLDARRDFTDVRDVVQAYLALMVSGTPSTVYNVCTGVARSMRAILDALVRRSTVAVSVETDPARLRPNDVPVVVGNPARLTSTTGWAPRIDFEQTLDDLLDYWRHVAEF
jgi:GDP-4-dehydro-6-deoxy-D-mannose reductase